MIALAQYPSGLKLDQTALSFYYKSLVNVTLSAQSKKYSQALDHFLDVRKWCELNCKYPYSIEISDLLFDGVRVRIGSYDDFVDPKRSYSKHFVYGTPFSFSLIYVFIVL